ncbi:MAG: OmpA family protein [Nitrospirae bacterium]|nr:OmpA family protein [Nitrospirota bacterium]
MAKKKKAEEPENGERWLISYADFITLLFAFFVVMYSVSAVNEGKLKVLGDSISTAFNPFIPFSATTIRIVSNQSGTNPTDQVFDIGILTYRKLKEGIKDIDKDQRIKVESDARGLAIRLPDELIFESGKADILPKFDQTLQKVAALLKELPNHLQIEGHTDNVPIKTSAFPSNWELSTMRSVAILRSLIAASIDPIRLSAAGYGEFKPISTNDTPEGRAKNRRVEIIVLNPGRESVIPVVDSTTIAESGTLPDAKYSN